MTRNDVAQLVLNTLQAGTVQASTDGSISIGDVTIATGVTYNYITSNQTYASAIDNDRRTNNDGDLVSGYIVELGEQLYQGDLKLDKDTTDVFGRPARTWSYDGEEIGTFAQKELMVAEYTTSVSGKEMYDAIGKTAFDKYDFESYVDGKENDFYKEIAKNNKDNVSETGNGALTQIFVDEDNTEVVVTVINTYLAQAKSDYNEKKETASFEIYGISGEKGTVSSEDFAVEDIEADDFVLVTYSWEADAIQSISDVEILSDVEISKFTTDDSGNNSNKGSVSAVTVDGTKYDSSNTLTYKDGDLQNYTDTNLKDTTYNVYLDQYGYAIGVEIVEGVDNYVFITGIDTGSSYLTTKNFEANALFLDGTSKVIDVKNNEDIRTALKGSTEGSALLNTWFKYSVNSNDVYTLSTVQNALTIQVDSKNVTDDVAQHRTNGSDNPKIDDKHISLNGGGKDGKIYGNDDSIYLVADLDVVKYGQDEYGVIKGADEVITGVDNVSIDVLTANKVKENLSISGAVSYGTYALYDDDNYVIAAVVVGESAGISQNIAYVISDKASSEGYDKTTGEWTWTREVVINGESVELTEVSDDDTTSILADEMESNTWYTVKYDANGNVKDIEGFKSSNGDYATTMKGAVTKLRSEDLVVVNINKELQIAYMNGGKTVYDQSSNVDDTGIRVADDVKVVLKQTNNRKTTTEYYEGYAELANVLDDLNKDQDGKNEYYFGGVIENSRFTSVIIIDKAGTNESPDGPDGNTGDIAVLSLTFDSNSKKFSVSAAGDKVNLPKGTLSMKVEQNGFTVATRTITDFGGRTENEVFAVTSNAAAGVVQANGEYTVTLTLKDSEGNSYTGTFTTTING